MILKYFSLTVLFCAPSAKPKTEVAVNQHKLWLTTVYSLVVYMLSALKRFIVFKNFDLL